jgi:ribonuclease-3
MDETALTQLQERLGVSFRNVSRLERALTHRSAATASHFDSNERLEFLGDSVLGLVVSENLFRLYPQHSEGDLAKSKAYIVSETALADAAMRIGLEEFVVMSVSEAATGGRRRRSILADAFEAIIAAVYLDRGIVAARRVVLKALLETLHAAATDQHRHDFKSSLQERTQAVARKAPLYRIANEVGQEHDKTFLAEAFLDEVRIGAGTGKSKKEAEQAAALDALNNVALFLPVAIASPLPESQ